MHKAKPNTIFDRVVNQLATTTSSSHTAQTAAAALLKYSNRATGSSGTGSSTPRGGAGAGGTSTPALVEGDEGDRVEAEDGLLKLEVGEKMLRWHAEAVGRCVELSSSGDV